MNNKIVIVIVVFALLACKRPVIKPTSVTPDTNFFFTVADVYGNYVQNPSSLGVSYKITFSQNNNIVYSITTSSNNFTIGNFKDGAYIYKITDTQNQYSYTQDSIICKNGTVLFGRNKGNTNISNVFNGQIVLSTIQAKPTFNFLSCSYRDTIDSGMPGVHISVTAIGGNISGGFLVYFYKNNKVSSNNLFNYGSLPNNGYTVSNSNKTFSTILYQYDVYNVVSFPQTGDSLYFAVYPSAVNPKSFDYLAPLDTAGNFQITTTGTTKAIIPYLWQ